MRNKSNLRFAAMPGPRPTFQPHADSVTSGKLLQEAWAKEAPKINVYTCELCGMSIVTNDRERGVTPAMLRCRVTTKCQGTMHSHNYQVDQNLKPMYEWYRPDLWDMWQFNSQTHDHIGRGGLILRPLVSTEELAKIAEKRSALNRVAAWRRGKR